MAPQMSAIYGLISTTSWWSVALQWSLESRLQALTDLNGSPEYVLTWSTQDVPLSRPIIRLRARERRKYANASGGARSGWPMPAARDYRFPNIKSYSARGGGKKGEQLNNLVAQVVNYQSSAHPPVSLRAGYPTPTVADSRNSRNATCGWENKGGNHKEGVTLSDLAYMETHGEVTTGSKAPTKGGAVLNPAFVLWLQGFRSAWLRCAPEAIPSALKPVRASRRPSRKSAALTSPTNVIDTDNTVS